MSSPRRELWSFMFFCKCSVSLLMRSVNSAICTSAEPVSFSWRRKSCTIFDFGSSLVLIVPESYYNGRVGAGPGWCKALSFPRLPVGHHSSGLPPAELFVGFAKLRILVAQDCRGKQGGIDGAGLPDGQRADWHSARHLHDGEQGIHSLERSGFDGHAEHG